MILARNWPDQQNPRDNAPLKFLDMPLTRILICLFWPEQDSLIRQFLLQTLVVKNKSQVTTWN